MKTPWVDEEHRSWRWCRRFALFPRNTFDVGWVWMRRYWVWECVWGWGFHDRYPYMHQTSCQSFEPKQKEFVHGGY